jgi:CheY-like chemotaxis protein
MSGYQVEQTHNGFQALDRAIQLLPDVVMTDLYIPGMDGYELARRLTSDPRTTHIPILAVTGYAPFTDPTRAAHAGCDAFLSKPCTWAEIDHAIHALLTETRRRRTA